MRIAYCIPQLFNAGGVERMVLLKAEYLKRNGYDVHIITAEQLSRPYFFQPTSVQIHDIGVDFSATLSLPPLKRLRERHKKMKIYRIRLNELLLSLKCDIVISTFSHEVNILPFLKDGSIKIVETHFPIYHKKLMANTFQYSFTTKLMYYVKDWMERNIIVPKYEQAIVLTSTDMRLWYKFTHNVISIPNTLTFTKECKISQLTNKRVIAIGHFSPIKDFGTLIKIWKIIKQNDKEWMLSIIGEGTEYQKITRMITEFNLNNSIEVLPTTKNIQDEYLNSSIYVLTSKYEGFPMVLLEAMQCGLPCVAFDCPNGPRDIIHNGEDGYLVPPNDIEEYATKLIRLMQNEKLRMDMGKKATQNIQRYFPDKIMMQWENLFNNLTTKKYNEKNRNSHNS